MPIGMERALEIALLTCGQSADQLTKQEVDAELDEVPAHYEVELEDRSGTGVRVSHRCLYRRCAHLLCGAGRSQRCG